MATPTTLAPPPPATRATKAKASGSKPTPKKITSPAPLFAPGEWGEPALPTFSWESGYRLVKDPETGEERQVQLTLMDVLYPTEDDIGVVFMAQGPDHDLLSRLLAVMLQSYLGKAWLVLHDVFVRWERSAVPPKAPDITAIRGGTMPPRGAKSYQVGRDGPLPEFIVEITSEETRTHDLEEKRTLYAALGIKEYLIIDVLPEEGEDWQLIGYRLGRQPHYAPLAPAAEGGLCFETVGLRFVAVGHERMDVYNMATGDRLLTLDESKARVEAESKARTKAEAKAKAKAKAEAKARDKAEAQAKAEAARADAEAKARATAEAKVRDLEEQLRRAGLLS